MGHHFDLSRSLEHHNMSDLLLDQEKERRKAPEAARIHGEDGAR